MNENAVIALLIIVGAGVALVLYNWLTVARDGNRGDTQNGAVGNSLWSPPKAPEDEWKKWDKL